MTNNTTKQVAINDIGSAEDFLAAVEKTLKFFNDGDLIEGTGGLRKLRFADGRRGKGKRGGLRVIYFWWDGRHQFWLFTLYGKDEVTDLTPVQRAQLKSMMKAELEARK